MTTPQCIGHHALLPMATGTSATTTGRQTWQEWVGTPIVDYDEDQRYLNGGRTGPKGIFHFKGVDKGLGKGIGKGT